MGQNPSSSDPANDFPVFKSDEWEQLPRVHPESLRNFHNLTNGEQVTEYQLHFASQNDYLNYLDSLSWRREEANIVQSRYLLEKHNQNLCSTMYHCFIYLEPVYTRLSEIKDIPYPDNLYVLYSALEGFQKLYESLHYFRVDQDLVCVDFDGIVKVWVNRDLEKNYPDFDNHLHDHHDDCRMVAEILELIVSNTDTDSEPESLDQFFRNKGQVGFQEAKALLVDYAEAHQVKIPQRFDSIITIMCDANQAAKNDDTAPQNQIPNEQQATTLISNGAFAHPASERPVKAQLPVEKDKDRTVNDNITMIRTDHFSGVHAAPQVMFNQAAAPPQPIHQFPVHHRHPSVQFHSPLKNVHEMIRSPVPVAFVQPNRQPVGNLRPQHFFIQPNGQQLFYQPQIVPISQQQSYPALPGSIKNLPPTPSGGPTVVHQNQMRDSSPISTLNNNNKGFFEGNQQGHRISYQIGAAPLENGMPSPIYHESISKGVHQNENSQGGQLEIRNYKASEGRSMNQNGSNSFSNQVDKSLGGFLSGVQRVSDQTSTGHQQAHSFSNKVEIEGQVSVNRSSGSYDGRYYSSLEQDHYIDQSIVQDLNSYGYINLQPHLQVR